MQTTSRGLLILFVVAYVAHGFSTQFGIIAQPMQRFMMKGLSMTAADVSTCLAAMMIPWVLKPFFGLLCDFVPLFGYRRKSYLIGANLLTAASFAVMVLTQDLSLIVAAYVLSAAGMAASTAVTVGLAVEGDEANATAARNFFAVQTFVYYSAIAGASLIGGWLCQHLAPVEAMHTAAGWAILPVLVVAVLTTLILKEKKSTIDREGLEQTWLSLKAVLKTKALYLVALFIWCWDFSPSLGVSLYFFESNSLHFPQDLIGQLAGWNSGGMVLGSLAYRLFISKISVHKQLYLAVSLGALSILAYLFLSAETAPILEIMRGVTSMLSILGIYGLAAAVCPKRAEVTVMATMLAVRSLALEASTYIGGQLFTHVFHNQLSPLILAASLTTALCLAIIPFLPSGRESAAPKEHCQQKI